MGTPGNGDGWADSGGGYDGLPDLPPEWGSIVIPDDPAELADDAALVRHELRWRRRRAVWRRRLGLVPLSGRAPAVLRLPLIITAIAIIAALTSLFAVVWPPARPSALPRAGNSAGGSAGRSIPVLDLVGADGSPVPLRSLLPAVIILIDGCTCTAQVQNALRAVPPGVRVVTVDRRAAPTATAMPSPQGPVTPIHALLDPTGELRGALRMTPQPGTATALFAARSGQVVRILPTAGAVGDYPAELSQLATR